MLENAKGFIFQWIKYLCMNDRRQYKEAWEYIDAYASRALTLWLATKIILA